MMMRIYIKILTKLDMTSLSAGIFLFYNIHIFVFIEKSDEIVFLYVDESDLPIFQLWHNSLNIVETEEIVQIAMRQNK